MDLVAARRRGHEPGYAMITDMLLGRLVQPRKAAGSQRVSHRGPPSRGARSWSLRRLAT